MKRSAGTLALLLTGFLFCETTFGQNQNALSLSLPGLSWSLEINAPGYAVEQKELAPTGDAARLFAVNKTTRIILSAFLEPAASAGGSKECREFYWSRLGKSPVKREHIRMYELGPLSIAEYIVSEHRGIKLMQKHVNAYLAEGDYWMDVHLSKVNYTAEDDDLFLTILKSIQIKKK